MIAANRHTKNAEGAFSIADYSLRPTEAPSSPAILAKPAARIPRIPARGQYSEKARIERLEFIRRRCKAELPHLQATDLIPEKLSGNIEALIGGVEIPVGLAGPLLFKGKTVYGPVYAPFATTEGALVASATRGAAALSCSGGVTTRVLSQKMQRVPLFVTRRMEEALYLADWIRDHAEAMRQHVREVSAHADLVSIDPRPIGNMVNVHFNFETGDAAGQNMTTACTWRACQWIIAALSQCPFVHIDDFFIEGNGSGDKKANYRALISGRGIRVTAECFLPGDILEQVLKVTPEQLQRAHLFALTGGLQSGVIGHNVNIANTLAAIYTATGQDIASVHESAVGVLHINQVEEGIYASMLLPGLVVGTVGGGTHLPRQQNLLEMMACSGPGKVVRLAEIIAGFALALDLSTMAAIAGGQFVSAHERLGRNRPVRWFKQNDFEPGLFAPGLQRLNGSGTVITGIEPLDDIELGCSIITELTACNPAKLVGLKPCRIHHRKGVLAGSCDVLVKIKPLDTEVIFVANRMAAMCGGSLAVEYPRFKDQTGFEDCHVREIGICRENEPRLHEHMPEVIDTIIDEKREIYIIIMELLKDVVCKDAADNPGCWRRHHIETALAGAARFHSAWYGRESRLLTKAWLGRIPTRADMIRMTPLWEALALHAAAEFPQWVHADDIAVQRRLIHSIADWWQTIENLPRTLIHNDFTPRNLCFRETDGRLKLCAYDWELATLHLPQHDLAELLTFVLTPEACVDEIEHFIEFHRASLQDAAGSPIDRRQWRRGYR